jgi:hypothetical protein
MTWRLFVSCALLVGVNHGASASCGSASCPLNSYHFIGQGSLQLSYVYEYINQDQIYVGSSKAFVGAIPQHHDEVQTINSRSVIRVHYGLSERISLGVDLPFIHREHSHIHHHDGEDLWESWNYGGLGDLVVSARVALLVPSSQFDPHVSLLAGVKLPTGVTRATNAEGEAAEVAIQPGSGSTDGVVGIDFRQALLSVPTVSGEYGVLPLIVGTLFQFGGNGTDDWRFGNSLLVSVGTEYQLARRASVLLQFNGRFQGYADVGSTGEPRENTGGSWIFASPGLNIQLSDEFSGYSYIQVPLYQNVHGIQQTAKLNLLFGIVANVGLFD